MVNIITGKINSGKSTVITKIYKKRKQGDGFVSVKRMQQSKVHSYEIMKLSDKSSRLLVIRAEYVDRDVEVACEIGPYLFLKNTLTYVEDEIKKMIQNNISPIYLDEIGELELYDQCFDGIFKKILEADVECYITVRSNLVQKVIDKYNLKNVNIVEV